jgi:hypothetical protein
LSFLARKSRVDLCERLRDARPCEHCVRAGEARFAHSRGERGISLERDERIRERGTSKPVSPCATE